MNNSKHAAPEVESGSGADPQTAGNTDLDSTDHAPREAAGDDALLRLIAGMAAGGKGRYVQEYFVTVELLVLTGPKGGDQ